VSRVRWNPNHFAAHQRSAHFPRCHGDTVGNGDGVEFKGCSTGSANAGLDVFRQFAEMIIQGPISIQVLATPISGLQIIIAETASAKHGAAPARLAPSIKEWLRGLGAGCVTAKSPLCLMGY